MLTITRKKRLLVVKNTFVPAKLYRSDFVKLFKLNERLASKGRLSFHMGMRNFCLLFQDVV
jgi:hypothetical protein